MYKAGIQSDTRLVISGDTLELFKYKQPFFYNWIDMAKKNRPHKGESSLIPKREDNIKRAVANVRRLVQCNQEDQTEKPKFLTLTYRENIQDLSRTNPDFTLFTRKVRDTYGDMQYIAVPEFQERGAVHYHALFFNLPFIQDFKGEMARVWPHGTTKIEAVRSMNAMPRYISKYMTKSLADKRTSGRRSFFTSRNLHRPIVVHNQERANQIIEQWSPQLNSVGTKCFQDFRGRDVTYFLFKGAKELTANLRLVHSF
jgi:hypothetical protein